MAAWVWKGGGYCRVVVGVRVQGHKGYRGPVLVVPISMISKNCCSLIKVQYYKGCIMGFVFVVPIYDNIIQTLKCSLINHLVRTPSRRSRARGCPSEFFFQEVK